MPNPTGVGADLSDSEQDDDVEYEEIEVEEVEEEVDDDDDGEQQNDDEVDDDFSQDLSTVNEYPPEDVVHDIKTSGKEELYNSGSLNQKNSTDRDSIGVYQGPSMTGQMDMAEEEKSHIGTVNLKYSELGKVVIAAKDHKFQESSIVGKIILKDHGDAHSYNNKARLDGDMILSRQTHEPSSMSGDELTAAISVKDNFGVEANGTQYSEEETKRMYLQSEDIKHRISRFSRLDVPMSMPRNLSPGTEFKDGNKRPAVICDFFAKGWCIKGKSCRFLHIRDATSQQLMEVEADANQKSAQRTNEGSERGSEKAQLDSFPDAAPSSAIGTSHSMERDHLCELGQGSRLKDESEDLQSSKEDNTSIPSFNNVVRESWYSRDYGKYHSEEMTGKRSQFMFDGPSFPLNHHSLSTSSSTSLQNVSGILPSTYIPNLSRSAMSFGSPSWNLDPPGSHKHSEHGASRFTLLQHSSSTFSCSEAEKPYWRDVSGDFIRSGGYKTKKTSYSWEYNWEPSGPFRPSSSITQSLLSSINQYDPIHDSIEPPKSRDRVFKSSTSTQGLSGPESNLGKQPTSGHYQRHENVLDNKNYGKDSISAKAESVATPVVDPQNRNALVKEETPLSTANVKYIRKGGTINTHHDNVNQTDRLIEKTKKMEPNGQTSAMDVDPREDEDMLRESKSKHFRVALIDFVKELVKPTWREGNLSKDAHKMIVKRAADRVLSTLPTHQIPCTAESVKLYLSSSQPKIAKLVEGYIEKYGKL